MDKEIKIDILALATCGRNREQRQIVSATHGQKIRVDILALATCGRNREQIQIVSATHGRKKR